MLGRLATHVVPTCAVALTAVVLLGPGAARPVLGVRVRGLPFTGGTHMALRLEGARRHLGAEEVAPLGDVTVEASDHDRTLGLARALLGPDGVGEAEIVSPAPLGGPLAIRVLQGATVLAEGSLSLRKAEVPKLGTGEIPGVASGELAIRVAAVVGLLASPFAGPLRVTVAAPDEKPLPDVVLEASAEGAEVPARIATNSGGFAHCSVKPLAHHIELRLSARAPDGRTGRWEGLLPVRPGAFWLVPSRGIGARPGSIPGELFTLSPAPRERAYLSVVTETGRIFGAVVPLAPDPNGFYAGRVDLGAASILERFQNGRFAQAIVSGDPAEQGPATIAWPLRPDEGAAKPPRLELLLDGFPAAEACERARVSHVRRVSFGVVGASALFEALLLIVQSRRSQRKLEADLAGSAAEAALSEADRQRVVGAARVHPALRVALAVALVLLSFTVLAALSTFR